MYLRDKINARVCISEYWEPSSSTLVSPLEGYEDGAEDGDAEEALEYVDGSVSRQLEESSAVSALALTAHRIDRVSTPHGRTVNSRPSDISHSSSAPFSFRWTSYD